MSRVDDPAEDINAVYEGSTALLKAVKKNKVLEVRRLLSLGADIEKRHSFGYAPLSWACVHSSRDSHIDTIETLLKNGANVNAGVFGDLDEDEGYTPLSQLIFDDNVKTVKLVLDYGADLKIQNSSGVTPLYEAVRFQRLEIIVKLLLDHGADVNLVNPEDGLTPFHFAIRLQLFSKSDRNIRLKVFQLLMNYGANVNVVNPINGLTPLHTASSFVNLDVIKLLLKNGANINARDNEGLTPLEYMLQRNDNFILDKETLSFLLHHTDLNLVDSERNNILHYSYGHPMNKENVFKHIAILIDLNLLDSKLEKIFFDFNYDLEDLYYDACFNELESAKSEKLKNSWVTFFNLLVDSRKKLKNYAGNEDIISDIQNDECFNKFPIYSTIMKKNMETGIKRRELFDKSTVILCDFLPIFNPTHIIIRDILDYILSKKDLSKFCQ